MEGDIKDIVLARLEKRLKDKDDEIKALRERVDDYENSDRVKATDARIEKLEAELRETQAALSGVMKKVGALEAAVVGIATSLSGEVEDGDADLSDPDLSLDGQSEPPAPDIFGPGVAASLPEGDAQPGKKDATSFFRMGKNA